jgi:hypothetical protein
MSRRLAGFAAAAVCALAAGPAALAASPAPTGTAHLGGSFVLAGTVTAADNVRGEHAGQSLHRTWTFTPGCATGACATVTLVRPRAGGTDTLTLTRRAPGYYVGSSSFYRPLRCGSRIYQRGERVPFRIAVRVTLAIMSNGQDIASRINASYRNQVRYNLTPCVAYLGHDAASYHGHIVLPAG